MIRRCNRMGTNDTVLKKLNGVKYEYRYTYPLETKTASMMPPKKIEQFNECKSFGGDIYLEI